ncbi:MAG: hypothetical protein J6U79_01115 [Paludibacteraceae bacterium]|jgi:hypothetical protein|nr:hypothetical protein [Paludibacteraceae bacterium]
MDFRYQEIVVKFEEKLHLLLKENKDLKQKNLLLEEEVRRMQEDLIEARNSFSELKNQYDKLKIAKTLSLSDDEKKEAYRQLSVLVRNVNACIKLINNNE